MIDTHAHLNFKSFKDDYDQIIRHSFNQGITAIINVGANLATSQQAVKIAQNYRGCYAAIALHPTYVRDEEFNQEKYVSLITLNTDTVKAIGETGLDFYHSSKDIDLQKQIFLQHLDLANDFDLPVIIHCRGSKEDSQDAYLELLKILKKFVFRHSVSKSSKPRLKGVMHCFQSDWSLAERFLNLGFYLGFNGPITFKNADPDLLEVIKKIPDSRILIETDSPYLTPEPHRGKRNEPLYVRFIAEKIAEIKNITFEKIIEITTKNAVQLFKF